MCGEWRLRVSTGRKVQGRRGEDEPRESGQAAERGGSGRPDRERSDIRVPSKAAEETKATFVNDAAGMFLLSE